MVVMMSTVATTPNETVRPILNNPLASVAGSSAMRNDFAEAKFLSVDLMFLQFFR